MSLIAWYKLDGNPNNELGTYTGSTSGTVTYPAGLIKQSAFFNTGRIDTNIPDSITGTMSISLWYKKTTDNWAMSIGVIGTRNGTNGWMLYRNSGDTAGFFRWYMHYNTTSSTVSEYYPWPGISGLTHNRWYHFVIIRESNGSSRLYVDGNIVANLVPPANFSSWRFSAVNVGIAAERAGSGNWNGTTQEIDDVKMYDHVLSDYEIKELSKAKVIHYTFNDVNEEPTENLVQTPITFTNTASTWGARENVTVTYDQLDPFGGTNAVRIKPNSTTDNFFGSRNTTLGTGTFTTSLWLKATKTTTLRIITGTRTTANGFIEYTANLGTNWQRYEFTGTITATPSHMIHLGGWSTWTDNTFDVFFAFPQIERKTYSTPFVDGIRNIGIADSSGYINTGTMALATAPNIVNTSKIGSNTINFNSGNNMTLVDSGQLNLQNYTYSFWIKLKNGFTGGFRRFLGRSGTGSDRSPGFWFLHTTNGIHLQQKLSNGGNGGPGDISPITLNEWHHVVMSCEFVNGNTVLKRWFNYSNFNSTTAASVSPLLLSTANLIFQADSANYEMDDFRVYATPLSDADVKALYEKRANFDNVGNAALNEFIEYQEPIVNTNLVLNLDANDKNSVSPIGCTGFNTARPLVTSTINTSSYTVTSDANIRLGNLDYYTAFAIDSPESSYGGDAASRHGITAGFNVRSGTKFYDASRALHMWVFNNSTNSWLPSSFFNGSRLSGHCYDTWTGFANHLLEVAQFVTDYNNIKSQFKNCTFIIMGSHRDSSHTTDKINVLLELGAPSNVSSLLTSAPEYILIGEPGLGAGNAYSWAYENYTTDPTRVAHTNFGLPIYGRKGNYFDFSLSTNFISVADNALLDIVGDKTLACWIYMGADSSGSGIVAKANSTVNGMALAYGWNSNGFQGIAWNSSNTPAIAKDLSRDIQKWCYLTVTQSGSTRTIYVHDEQGLRTANSTVGVHTWNNTLPLYIGADSSGTSRVPNGTRIAMVSVYDRALTAGEVLTNFNNTKTNFYNDGNKNTINALGQGTFSEFVEGETLATTGVKQAITNNGTLVINGEFSEVD
jgi:hypothetical protein